MSSLDQRLLPNPTTLWQETLGWAPDATQQQLFQQVYEQILAGNQRLNLTRITATEDFWEKHLWDSLRGIPAFLPVADRPLLSPAAKVIDIGTGAGFPGLPVAIARPDWHVTLLDSTRKKMTFLNELITTLQLTHVQTLVGRAEEIGQQAAHRETYDVALIRAVAAEAVCAEYTLPLLKPGGIAILYRGHYDATDVAPLASVVTILGGQMEQTDLFQTPMTHSDRHCLLLRKVKPTPAQYPRAVGLPVQKPLT